MIHFDANWRVDFFSHEIIIPANVISWSILKIETSSIPPPPRFHLISQSPKERIRELLEPMAEARTKIAEEGKARPAGFLTASEIDPLSTAFRKLVGLEEIQGKYKFMKSKKALLKPRVALLDLARNQYAISGEFLVLFRYRHFLRGC